MIELLAVQAITNLALAAVVILLRRQLYPMIATAGPVDAGFWLRSIDVLVVDTPPLMAAKTVIRIRWLFTEELYLIRRLRVYQEVMDPSGRYFYKRWKAWMQGDARYDCLVEKPRGLARLYNKAVDVVCFDKEDEMERKLWKAVARARRR
jgi:hypothetical protein